MNEVSATTVGNWHSHRRYVEVDRIVARALRGGTPAMRAMGTMLLPMDFRERSSVMDYQARLDRTFLTPTYSDTVKDLSSRPFEHAVTLEGTTPPELERIEIDADRSGTNLTSMAHTLLENMWDAGFAAILVDKPDVRVPVDGQDEPRVMNRSEEQANDVRPYFAVLHPDNIINWKWRSDHGRRILERIHIYSEEDSTREDGSQFILQRVTVWSEQGWSVWEREAPDRPSPGQGASGQPVSLDVTARQAGLVTAVQSDNEQYRLVNEGPNPLGYVPVAVRGIRRDALDPFKSTSTLRDLAWKNVEDWQFGSSENNNLHWHGYPVFWGAGVDAQIIRDGLVYGAGATLLSSSDAFKVGFVETTGAAAAGLGKKREVIRAEMAAMGSAPLLEARSSGTAMGAAIDERGSQTQAQAAVEDLEWLIYDAYEIAADWASVELPDDFDIDIYRDFSLTPNTQPHLQTIDAARARKDMSLETYLAELQRYNVINRDLDIEEEIARIDQEGPSLSDMVPAQFGGAMQQAGDPMPQDGEQQGDPQQGQQPQPQQTGNVQP